MLDEDGKCMKSDCLVAVKSGSFFGYDKKGNELCKFDVEDMKAFGDGSYAAACRSGKWGFVDLSGNWIMDPIYDDARSFCNGFAAVCIESKWGYIDEKGDLVVECIFDDAKDFTEDKKSLVNQNGIWNSLEMLCK